MPELDRIAAALAAARECEANAAYQSKRDEIFSSMTLLQRLP